MVAAGAIVCTVVIRGAADARSRRLGGLLIAMALFVVGEGVIVAAGAAGLAGGWARALALQFSRLIEAIAAGIFVLTVLDYLQAEHAAVSVAFASRSRPSPSSCGRRAVPTSPPHAWSAA